MRLRRSIGMSGSTEQLTREPFPAGFGAPSFVGRSDELRALADALAGVVGGTGRFVAIAGEPGIGKTRLMAEFARVVSANDTRVLWSQMVEDPSAPPFFCWTLALRAYLRQCSDETLISDLGSSAADMAAIVPELGDRAGFSARAGISGSSGARYQLFDAVTRLLLMAASRQPLVLLFDNLQSADRSALALLEYFCQQLVDSPVLVVGAYRHSEFDRRNPLRAVLGNLSRCPGFLRLSLGGLSVREVAELLDSCLGSPPPASLAAAVHEQSGGNPLFVFEVGSMLARHMSTQEPHTRRSFFEVPGSLQDVINARLDTLPAETSKLLRVAAILGREFDSSMLAELADDRAERVRESLEEAESELVISAVGPDRFRFHHVLFREVLYSEHSTVARVRLHRKAGELLESRLHNDPRSDVSELAHHYFEAAQAGMEGKAVRYCREAAEAALARRAYSEAVALYERASQAAELQFEPDLELRFSLLLGTGRAQYQSGELNAATQTLMKSAILAYRQRWWERLADALFAYQLVCQQSGFRHVASVPLHRELLQHVSEDAKGLKARVLASLAKAYRTAGAPELAARSFRESISLARECGEPRTLLDCLRKGNWTIGRGPAAMREGLEVAREALALAREHGPTEAVLDSLTDVVFQLCDLGEIDEAERHLRELSELAREERQPHFLNVLTGFETAVAILRGNWREALSRAQQGIKEARLQRVFGLQGRHAFQIFAIKKAQGELKEFRGVAERIIAASEDGDLWLPGQILLHCELDQRRQATEALHRLGNLAELPRDDLYLIALIYLAEACVSLRCTRHCAQLYALLLGHRGLNATLPGALMLGAVSGYLGSLAAATRRFDDARELYEEALEMNTTMKAWPALVRTQLDYARLLIMLERGDDLAHARRLIAQAMPVAEQLQLRSALRAIAELNEQAGIDGLTRRELDILKIVATGSSNSRIATALHISQSTVTTHIRNIFRKTGATNRTEAAAYARRLGLLDQN